MRTLIAFVAVLATAALVPAVAPGKGSPGVIRSGKCTGNATWKLKAKNDDASIEIDFEVDQNVVGRRWNVTLTRGTRVVFRGTRVTRAPSGSFSVQRLVANPAGPNRISALARASAGGQVCRASLTV